MANIGGRGWDQNLWPGKQFPDARALELVLLGGRTGAEVEGHDWEYILTQLGWLHLDRTLGLAAWRTGLVMMFGALLWGAIFLIRHRDSPVLTFPGPAE